MAKKFKFIDLNKQLLPQTKGKNQNGVRFYEIDSKSYPSITSILSIRKSRSALKDGVRILLKQLPILKCEDTKRGKATHNLVENYLKGETPSEQVYYHVGLFRLMKPYLDNIDNIHLIERLCTLKN